MLKCQWNVIIIPDIDFNIKVISIIFYLKSNIHELFNLLIRHIIMIFRQIHATPAHIRILFTKLELILFLRSEK